MPLVSYVYKYSQSEHNLANHLAAILYHVISQSAATRELRELCLRR